MGDAAMVDMSIRGTPYEPAYTVTARVLHWLTAALVVVQAPLGIIIANVEMGAWADTLYNLHKSIGATLIPLVLIRLAWRLTHPPAPLPKDIPEMQRIVAESMHWSLYALLIVQGLLGWIATSAYPAPVPVFGLFELPAIWSENRALSDQLFKIHRFIGIALVVLIAGHAGAALQHHFIRKDRVLMRMITGG
jgi:cytochrome b561